MKLPKTITLDIQMPFDRAESEKEVMCKRTYDLSTNKRKCDDEESDVEGEIVDYICINGYTTYHYLYGPYDSIDDLKREIRDAVQTYNNYMAIKPRRERAKKEIESWDGKF